MRMTSLRLLVAAAAFALAVTAFPSFAVADEAPAAQAESSRLQSAIDALAQRARPGVLGVAVLDLGSGASAGVHAREPFPMMSVFKAPVAAAVLARVDEGSLSLAKEVTIERADVLDGSAVPSIGALFKGERMSFTVERLLAAAVSESDNTAVDALLKVLGGPQAATAFLRGHGIEGLRIDLDERGVSRIFNDLPPGQEPPAGESDAAWLARRQRGYRAFLADARNRSTPEGAVAFLRKLHDGQLLSAASTARLLRLMEAQTTPRRLRAGLPEGVRLADKTGTSATVGGRTAAFNDIGMLTWPDGRTVLVAAFLSDSPATGAQRDALFAELARRVAAAVEPEPLTSGR